MTEQDNKTPFLSYSMMAMDRTIDNIDRLISDIAKISSTWIPDEIVEQCTNCKIKFTYWNRKHHCRLCANIFCDSCTKYRKVIPKQLLELLPKESKVKTWNDTLRMEKTEEKRVCLNCKDLIEKIRKYRRVILAFHYAKLDILELHKASTKCESWKYAANIALTIFRNIQRKLPFMKYTEDETEMLWRNSKYFNGHSKYMLALLRNCKTDEDVIRATNIFESKNSLVIRCEELRCTRNCQKLLTSVDAMNLLVDCFNRMETNELLKKFTFKQLHCGDGELACYIPLLVYNIKTDNSGLLTDELTKRCGKSPILQNTLYLELLNYVDTQNIKKSGNYGIAFEKIVNNFSSREHGRSYTRLIEGNAFIDMIKNIGQTLCHDGLKYDDIKDKDMYKSLNSNNGLTCPLDPTKKISNIMIEKIKYKDSATKPIIIPCQIQNSQEVLKLMYKGDNVRQDQIIMNIIRLVNIIVKKEEKIDLELITYNVLPIGENKGLIEIVQNADTIYEIEVRLKNDIQNYMMEKNSDIVISKFRDSYIKSVAAYSVISYALGIGDRHLDNIMISRTGKLFHIDYGFIMGQDPMFNNPGLRVTPEMIRAIGGLDSIYYVQFKELATKIYNVMRRNSDIILNMLLLLPKIKKMKIDENEIIKQIMNRLLPGDTDIVAKFHFVKALEEHNITNTIKDLCHYHSEQTITSGLIRLNEAIRGFASYWKPNDKLDYYNKKDEQD